MNLFEKELREMFGRNSLLNDYTCCGNVFIAKLDDNLRAKLQFVTGGVCDKYTGIEIKVINRTEGLVDSQRIKFTDVIGYRSIGSDRTAPYIWNDRNEAHWYTPITAEEKERIADAITDYIAMYQSEEIGMKLQ